MPAYWIAHVIVTNEETYGRYASGATAAIEQHGGEFLARGGRPPPARRHRPSAQCRRPFPSMEAAEAPLPLTGIQAALAHARGAAVRDLVIVESL